MGWCQGRICGPPVAALLAAGLSPAAAESSGRPAEPGACGQPPAEPAESGKSGQLPAGPAADGHAAALSRPLAQPVPLGVLARLAGLDEPSGAQAAGTAAGAAQTEPGEAGASPDNDGKM
jgi:hypothetical protein